NRYSSVDDEPLGQLKMTIAQFFRVNGDSTQHRGVVPDILLPTAARSLEHGERALDNALPWTQIKPAKFLTYTGAEVQLNMAELRALHQARASADPGFKYLLASSRFEDIANDSTEVSLLEANRSAERKQREATRSRLLDDLRQAQGLSPATDNNETNSIAADLILLETAQILSDAVFGEYRERLVVQIDNGSVPTPTIEVSGSGELQQ
ncbi:MAG: carboxy terminal-processing peptidase, partial [Arenicellales bacterium]|nr:carboxy terminal-processing peptidase [Arenicellales bacterium]